MIKFQIVENACQLGQAKALLQEYAKTRKNDPALVDFSKEINGLPGKYAPPQGNIILAYCDGSVAGCVAVHKLDNDICEMKRLYVSPKFRKRGMKMSHHGNLESSQSHGIQTNAFRFHSHDEDGSKAL